MVSTQQQHLAIEVIHAADRTRVDVRRNRQRVHPYQIGARPDRGEASGCALRCTPRSRQNRSATIPRCGSAGVDFGSNGASSSLPALGSTSVPSGPSAMRSSSMSPSGPPSIGRTARKLVCTSKTPRPAGRRAHRAAPPFRIDAPHARTVRHSRHDTHVHPLRKMMCQWRQRSIARNSRCPSPRSGCHPKPVADVVLREARPKDPLLKRWRLRRSKKRGVRYARASLRTR